MTNPSHYSSAFFVILALLVFPFRAAPVAALDATALPCEAYGSLAFGSASADDSAARTTCRLLGETELEIVTETAGLLFSRTVRGGAFEVAFEGSLDAPGSFERGREGRWAESTPSSRTLAISSAGRYGLWLAAVDAEIELTFVPAEAIEETVLLPLLDGELEVRSRGFFALEGDSRAEAAGSISRSITSPSPRAGAHLVTFVEIHDPRRAVDEPIRANLVLTTRQRRVAPAERAASLLASGPVDLLVDARIERFLAAVTKEDPIVDPNPNGLTYGPSVGCSAETALHWPRLGRSTTKEDPIVDPNPNGLGIGPSLDCSRGRAATKEDPIVDPNPNGHGIGIVGGPGTIGADGRTLAHHALLRLRTAPAATRLPAIDARLAATGWLVELLWADATLAPATDSAEGSDFRVRLLRFE